MQARIQTATPIGPLGLGGAGGSGLSWAADHFHWNWPPFVIYFIFIASVISLIAAVVLAFMRTYAWLKSKSTDSKSFVFWIVEKTRRRLIPVMLGIMGFAGVVLIAGAILGAIAYSKQPPTDQTAKTRSQPPPQRPQLANVTPTQPSLPDVKYNERQIREMLDALTDASVLIKKIPPINQRLQNRLINAQYFLTSEGKKKTIALLVQSKEELQNDVWQPIDDFVYKDKDHAPYQAQMRIAFALDHEAARGELSRAVQVIIDKLGLLQDEPDRLDPKTISLFDDYYKKAQDQGRLFSQWMSLAQTRIEQMQKNLKERGLTGYEAAQ